MTPAPLEQGMLLSPCVGICRLDDTTGWCLGCARDTNELASWRELSAVAYFLWPVQRAHVRSTRRGRFPGSRVVAAVWPSQCFSAPVARFDRRSPLTVAGAAPA
jgi:predicted Fe-S protein YdhL (DUF1289 family)